MVHDCFLNTAPADLKNPYSLAWNAQIDHEVNPRLLLRLGYEERSTRRDFVLEPVPAGVSGAAKQPLGRGGGNTGTGLLLLNSGRSRYRELQAVGRFRFQEGRNIFLSYVRSQAAVT